MPLPVFDTFADTIYDLLAPYAKYDEEHGFALAHFINSIGKGFEEVDDYTHEDDYPPWAKAMDVTRAPIRVLPWLGAFVGIPLVRQNHLETVEDYENRYRALIIAKIGFARGSRAAMVAAARQYLTGNMHVGFIERTGGDPGDEAYNFTVVTLEDETADEAKVEEALRAVKPAGLKMTYAAIPGYSWVELAADPDTLLWTDVPVEFTDWEATADGP